MSLSIDPNIKGYINAAVAICGAVSLIGIGAFPDYIPSAIAKGIFQTASFIFLVYGGLNSAGNFLSSSKPGALAPPDPPVVKAAQAVADLKPSAPPLSVEIAKAIATRAVEDHRP